jgi:DNA polymerase-3 subunit chi
MTEVAFHFNVPGKLPYACRLLRKIYQSGKRARVIGPVDLIGQLEQALWTFSAPDFIPHCGAGAAPAVLAHSPIVLATTAADAPRENDAGQSCDVLVNLGAPPPEALERYARLIELVSQDDEQDRAQARARWRHYAERGCAITRHDLLAARP